MTRTDTTGKHPGADKLQTELFRQAVMAGMPKAVKETMDVNPDIPGCPTQQWERHLDHHWCRYLNKEAEEKGGVECEQVQLLKL